MRRRGRCPHETGALPASDRYRRVGRHPLSERKAASRPAAGGAAATERAGAGAEGFAQQPPQAPRRLGSGPRASPETTLGTVLRMPGKTRHEEGQHGQEDTSGDDNGDNHQKLPGSLERSLFLHFCWTACPVYPQSRWIRATPSGARPAEPASSTPGVAGADRHIAVPVTPLPVRVRKRKGAGGSGRLIRPGSWPVPRGLRGCNAAECAPVSPGASARSASNRYAASIRTSPKPRGQARRRRCRHHATRAEHETTGSR